MVPVCFWNNFWMLLEFSQVGQNLLQSHVTKGLFLSTTELRQSCRYLLTPMTCLPSGHSRRRWGENRWGCWSYAGQVRPQGPRHPGRKLQLPPAYALPIHRPSAQSPSSWAIFLEGLWRSSVSFLRTTLLAHSCKAKNRLWGLSKLNKSPPFTLLASQQNYK